MADHLDGTQLAMMLSRLADGTLGEAGRQAWQALVGLVRRIGRRDAEPATALAAIGNTSPDNIRDLAETLKRHADADPEFAAALRAWWSESEQIVRENDAGHVNVNSGPVHGLSVQARDVTGPITFGSDGRDG